MAPTKAKEAVDFNAMLTKDRQRRKNQALVAQVFAKGRRSSAPGMGVGNRKPGAVPSMASRVGIQKKPTMATFGPRPQKQVLAVAESGAGAGRGGRPAGNVDAEWTHDLHSLNNPPRVPVPRGPKAGRGNRRDQLHTALHGSASSPALNSQFNIIGSSKSGMSIRGLAGPYIVIAKNLALGTTIEDIEAAMAPIGGVVLACTLIAERPKVIAEIELETREGADNVVETLNNQSADGNILSVYHKISAPASKAARSNPAPPPGPRADIHNNRSEDSRSTYTTSERYTPKEPSSDRRRDDREDIVDGTYGFESNDRMDTDDQKDNRYNDTRPRGGLYSDDIVGGGGRGRGGSRDRGRGNEGRGYRR